MRSTLFWTWLPLIVAMVLFGGPIPGSGFVADDAFNLATHANHGDWAGEWSSPTYAHAGGDRGHIWRPIPAWLQHVAASGFGRVGSTFRALNLGVHLINILLISAIARRLGASSTAAGLAALFWTTHAAMPEAVCWSSDIYDLVATTFALLATGAATSSDPRVRWVGVSALTLAACLSKESSVALAPALAAAAWAAGGTRRAVDAGIASIAGVVAYGAMHRSITDQNYADVAASVPFSEAADAALMNIGWWASPPARAPMAHLFNPATDSPEVLMGAVTLVGISLLIAHQFRHGSRASYLLAGIVAAVSLTAPAAFGIPFIGVAPLRYVYMPLAVGLAIAASRWTGSVARPWIIGILMVGVLGSQRIASRTPAFANDASLWSAERRLEPSNSYAAGSLARAWIADGRTREAVELWASAIESAPEGVRVFDKANERWLLGQTAFMKGHPDIALTQVLKLLNSIDQPVPAMAHCLHADSLDALGRHEEALKVAQRCEP